MNNKKGFEFSNQWKNPGQFTLIEMAFYGRGEVFADVGLLTVTLFNFRLDIYI